jgi:hypothetical protein
MDKGTVVSCLMIVSIGAMWDIANFLDERMSVDICATLFGGTVTKRALYRARRRSFHLLVKMIAGLHRGGEIFDPSAQADTNLEKQV